MRDYMRYLLESFVVHSYVAFLKLLSIDQASTVGKWVGQQIGCWTRRTKIAKRALQQHLPDMSEAERDQVISAMWGNLGQVGVEYAHLQDVLADFDQRVEIIGQENLNAFMSSGAGMIFSAHLGNWEIATLALYKAGVGPLNAVYREPNNKSLNQLICSLRKDTGVKLIAKGASGVRQILEALTAQEKVLMLLDQKMNNGIAVPFFGQPVMTAPAFAQLSLKFNCPVLPMRVIRTGAIDQWTTRFQVIIEPQIFPDQYRHLDLTISDQISLMMYNINQILERWIRQNPEQWLWIHNRWPAPHLAADVQALWHKQHAKIKKYIPKVL